MKIKITKFLPSLAQWNRATPFVRLAYVVGISALILFIIKIASFFLIDTNEKVDKTYNRDESQTTTVNNPVTIIGANETIDDSLIYSMDKVNSLKLKKELEKSSNIKISNNSNNTIEIIHTGKIRLFSKESEVYIYTGGNIEILINGSTCYEYKNFKIPSMRPSSRENINNNLHKVISNIVNQNVIIFSKKIIECIKN